MDRADHMPGDPPEGLFVAKDSWSTFARSHFLTDQEVLQGFLDIIVAKTESRIGYFHFYDAETEEIGLTVWSKEVLKNCRTTHVSHYPLASAGIWADCIRHHRVVIHNDYAAEIHRRGLPDGHFQVSRHMSAPIRENGRTVAILGVGNKDVPYAEGDADLLARELEEGWGLVRRKLREREEILRDRRKFFNSVDPLDLLADLIDTIGSAVELRDEYTSHHQTNVSTICDLIAVEMALPDFQRFGLRIGASIHDIGKIAVPADILSKPIRLLPAEFEIIKHHAPQGARLFRHLNLPWPIADMIGQHHERMDGSGYPDGLVGEMICLEARIIAVADTFDAMVSDRPYRHAPGWDAALGVLMAERGVKFDPYVVDAFLNTLEGEGEGEGGRIIRGLYER
ncbi:MAG: GAF domain-containing protein [Alphaproteobacteria bacterium]|nr:GAF domain-containing protein [Alphaproteobacteria bacterium]